MVDATDAIAATDAARGWCRAAASTTDVKRANYYLVNPSSFTRHKHELHSPSRFWSFNAVQTRYSSNHGTNDAYTTFSENNSDFIADYVTLIDQFQSLPTKPKVYIVEPPPLYNNPVFLSNDILTQQVIPNIVQVASQTHTKLIDAHTPLVNHPELFVDGIHHSADGAQVIADTIYATLILNK